MLRENTESELLREVHNPQVWRIEVPEGRSGGDVLSVKMWTGHYGSVLALCYSPDGKYLASASADGRALVWSCPNYTQCAVCVCAGRVDSLCWVSSSILVTNSPGLAAKLPELMVDSGADEAEGCVQLWQISKGGEGNPVPLCTIRHEGGGNVGAMAGWSPPPPPPWMRKQKLDQGDARNLGLLVTAAGSSHSSLRLWRPDMNSLNSPPRAIGALHGHDDVITDAAFSSDGCFLASASVDQTILVWDVSTMRKDDPDSRHSAWCCRQLKGHTARVCSVAWGPVPPDPDEGLDYMPRVLISGSVDKIVRVWEVFAAPDSGRSAQLVDNRRMGMGLAAPVQPEGEFEPKELPDEEERTKAGGPALSAALVSLLRVLPRDRRSAEMSDDLSAALSLLAADIRRGQTGVQDIPPVADVEGLTALVWKLVAQTRKTASVLRKVEKARLNTELSGLRISTDVLGLWRCWLPLARKLRRWLRQHTIWGRLPLVVGVGGAVGCGKTTAIQVLQLVLDRVLREEPEETRASSAEGSLLSNLDSRPLRVLQVQLDEMASDQTSWWVPEMRNQHLAGIFGREGLGVLENFAAMLGSGATSLTGPDIIFVEGWRVGIAHPHFRSINRRLDRLLFINGPLQVISTTRERRAKQEIAELQSLKQEFFADQRWVLGANQDLAHGRVDWSDSPKLDPFGMELRIDRHGNIVSMSTTFSEPEYFQVGTLKGKGYPKYFDVTVGLGGDPEEQNERRYRGEIGADFYLVGQIETKRERRVIRRAEFEGQFMRKLIGGGTAPVRTEADIEAIDKGIDITNLMDALAAFGKRPSSQAKWPADSADEKMWEKTVRELAQKERIPEPSRTVDPTMRLDDMVALATQRGLRANLLRPPKEAQKSTEKKAAMVARLQFHALIEAMATIEISFFDFLEMVMDFDRTAYEMRDRRIFDQVRSIADRPVVPIADFVEALHKALTVNPPDSSGLLQTVAYERDGGIDAVFNDYYRRVAVPRWLLPVQRRADTVVHYDESFAACHLNQRDGQHSGVVTALAWSPRQYVFCNGAYTIATASADGNVRLWRAERGGVCEVALRGHNKRVTAVAFSPGGGELISGSVDGTVRIWSIGPIAGRRAPVVLGHTAAVEAVATSPTEGLCAATDQDFVMVWRLQALTALDNEWKQLHADERSAAAELHITESKWQRAADTEQRSREVCEQCMAMYGTTGREWAAAARRLAGLEYVLRTGAKTHGAVLSLSWSQTGQLVGGCEGGVVLVWRVVPTRLGDRNGGTRVKSGVLAAVLGRPGLGPVRCVQSCSAGGSLRVAGASGRQLVVWDAVRLPHSGGCVWDPDCGSSDETHCIDGADRWGWVTGGGICWGVCKGCKTELPMRALRWGFADNNRQLCDTCGPNHHGACQVRDPRPEHLVRPSQWAEVSAEDVRVAALDWSDDGRRLIVGTEGNGLDVWSVATSGVVTRVEADKSDATESNGGDAWADLQAMLTSIDTGSSSSDSNHHRDAVDNAVCGMQRTLRHRTHSAVGGVGFGPAGAVHRGRRLLAIGLGAGVRMHSVPAAVQSTEEDKPAIAGSGAAADDTGALSRQQTLDATFVAFKAGDERKDDANLTEEDAVAEIVPGTPDGACFWF